MNITQLKYFRAVATYHTVSEAAEHLYISQPSLSNAIKELEREFAVTLFYRRYNGMFLTPEGTRLYNASADLIAHFDEVEDMMRSLGKDTRQIKLGIPPMISSFILADIYKSFASSDDGSTLSISEGGRYELLEQLNGGIVDMVILPHTTSFDSSFSAKKIGRLEIVCCVSKNSRLANLNEISPRELDGVPLLLFSDSFFQTKTIKKWFNDNGVEPKVSLQTEQLSTAIGMIGADLTAGFMLKEVAEKNDALAAIPLSPSVFVDISVIRKKDSYLFDALASLEDYLVHGKLFDK